MGIWRRLALATLLTVTCAQAVVAQSGTPAPEAIDIDVDGTVFSLSPDGAWLFGAGADDREVCLWSVPDLDARCDGFVPGLDPASIAWSPDGTTVAFSQDAVRQFIDSDVFTMATADGAVVSVTDDPDEENERLALEGAGVSLVDTQPLWADDGTAITFIRTIWSSDRKQTTLARVDLAAGGIEDIFVLSPTQPFAAYAPLFAAADGGILVAIDALEPGAPANGIWKVAADGARIDRVTPAGDDDGRYTIQAVAEDRATAVVQDFGAVIAAQQAGHPVPWSVLDLETGEVSPLLDEADFTTRIVIFEHPVFAGETLLYLVQVDAEPLAFATGRGEPEILLEVPGAGERLPTSMTLAETGDVLVTWNDRTASLITEAAGSDGDDVPAPCSCVPPAG